MWGGWTPRRPARTSSGGWRRTTRRPSRISPAAGPGSSGSWSGSLPLPRGKTGDPGPRPRGRDGKGQVNRGPPAAVPLGRMTIGLYNSYDPVKFAEAHRRALARAGPVALAFDANLATFGFPYGKDLRTPLEVVRWVSGTTSIGEGGKYLVELAEAGRFQTFDFPRKGFPPQLGEIVVTTNRPDPPRRA